MTPSQMEAPRREHEADLSQVGARVERLLDELRGMTSPLAWERVDELVRSLVDLYGAGLGRLLALVDGAGALDDGLRNSLADDDLVASLLTLHGLHPLGPGARIRRALAAVAAEVGAIELVAVEGTLVRLRVACLVAMPPGRMAGLGPALERLVQEAAPEVSTVEIDGLPAPPAGPLVQIDLSRSRARRDA